MQQVAASSPCTTLDAYGKAFTVGFVLCLLLIGLPVAWSLWEATRDEPDERG